MNITFFPSKWLICWVLVKGGKGKVNKWKESKCEIDFVWKLFGFHQDILFLFLSCESTCTDKQKISFNSSSQREYLKLL